jgi:AcrR family transcriptional regulator
MQENSTKQKILSAARKLFVDHGYAGTSIGKIAKLAGITHSLVFHHFTNKEQLWLAVKENIVADADLLNQTLPDTTLSLADFLEETFTSYTRFYHHNPDIIQMFNWQRVERDVNKNLGVTNSTNMQRWIKAFKHFQKQGDINAKLDPAFIITMIFGAISSAALDPNIFLGNTGSQKKYMKFCVQVWLKGLK